MGNQKTLKRARKEYRRLMKDDPGGLYHNKPKRLLERTWFVWSTSAILALLSAYTCYRITKGH